MANDPQALLEKLDALEQDDLGERLPRAFGPYLLLKSLAKGGMGEVFLAKSGAVVGFEKVCVVKTLRPHLTDDREYVARFIDEARVVVQLGHRNICQVFDVGRVGERYYLAMEQIAGKDLRTVVDVAGDPVATSPMSQTRAKSLGKTAATDPGNEKLDVALAVHVMAEVLDALDYAHRFVDLNGKALHLVHRDVSPQNVMVSFEGEVKLIDFGLAASTVKLEQTSPNVVMGKLAYMSPEQLRAEKLDARADLFAAAVMLTEMVTGERYYQGLSSYEVWNLAAHGKHRPRRFAQIPSGLRTVLDRALAAEANDRFPTCAAFRDALVRWRQQQGLYADAATLRRLMQERFSADIRAHRELLAGVNAAKNDVSGVLAEADELSLSGSGAPELTRSFARSLGTLAHGNAGSDDDDDTDVGGPTGGSSGVDGSVDAPTRDRDAGRDVGRDVAAAPTAPHARARTSSGERAERARAEADAHKQKHEHEHERIGPRDATEPTRSHPTAKRPRWWLGAAAGALVGVLGYAGVAAFAPAPRNDAPADAGVAVVDEAVVRVVPAAVDAGVVDKAEGDDDGWELEMGAPGQPPHKKKKKRSSSTSTSSASSTPTPSAPAETPQQETPPPATKSWSDMNMPDRFSALEKACGASSCAAPLLAKRTSWAKDVTPEEMAAFKDRMRTCYASCTH